MSQVFVLYLGSLVFRSLGIAAIAGVCTLWVRNAAARHAIWVAVMIAMLAMPFADALLPSSWVPDPVERVAVEPLRVLQVMAVESISQPIVAHPVMPAPAASRYWSQRWNWWAIAALFYALVGAGLLARLGLAYRKILQLHRESLFIISDLRDGVAAVHGLRWRIPRLRESDAVRVPFTIGFLRPVVILPSDWKTWNESKLRAVFSHEFAHVRRGDWAIAALAAFNRCVFWINPLTFFLEKHLAELAEQASDDCALRMTNDSTLYAEVLLQFAAAQSGHRILKGSIAMARHKMLARIERVLAIRRPGNGVLSLAGWALVMSLATPVLFTAAAVQATSSVAPAPAYAELVAQLPLAGVPRVKEQSPFAEVATVQTDSKIGVVFQTPNLLPAPIPRSNVIVGWFRRASGQEGSFSEFSALIQQPAEGPASLTSLPKVITRLNPIYSAAAWMGGVDGAVHLSLTIGPDGHVSKIDVLSSASPLLTPGAVDAIQQWVFEPQQVDSSPVSITREIDVSFGQVPEPAANRVSYSLSYPSNNEIHIQLSGYPGDDVLPDSAEDFLNRIQQISSGRRPAEAPATGAPFSFGLRGTSTGEYSIEIGGRKTSYECLGSANCAFLVSSAGYVNNSSRDALRSQFGVLVDRDSGAEGDTLTLSCQAQECTVTGVDRGKTISRKLNRNEGTRLPASVKISGTVD